MLVHAGHTCIAKAKASSSDTSLPWNNEANGMFMEPATHAIMSDTVLESKCSLIQNA